MMNRLAFLFVLLFLPFVIEAQENKVPITYTIKSGDTYGTIAPQCNTKVDSLLKWNPNVSQTRLQVGQEIIVGWEEEVVNEQKLGSENLNQGSVNGGSVNGGSVNGGSVNGGIESGGSGNGDTGSGGSGNGGSGNGGSGNGGSGNGGSGSGDTGSGGSGSGGSQTYTWVWLLLGLLIGMVLGAFLLYVLFAKKLKAELEHKENELSRVNYSLTNEKSNNSSELSRLRLKNQNLEQKNNDLDNENNSLREEIARLKTAQQRVNEYRTERTIPVSTNMVSSETSGSSTALYADAIIDNCFVKVRETPNEDSIFILHLNGENSADFSIHKSAYQRVVANPSFLEGCEKQVLGDTMQLEIVSEGKAQRELSNGKWKVINKLNVIIR